MVSLRKSSAGVPQGLNTPPPSFSQSFSLETKGVVHSDEDNVATKLDSLRESIMNESDSSLSSLDYSNFSGAHTPETAASDNVSDNELSAEIQKLSDEHKQNMRHDQDTEEDTQEDSDRGEQKQEGQQTKKRYPKRKPLPSRHEDAAELLDLSQFSHDTYNYEALRHSNISRQDVALLHHVFHKSQRLVVVTGAGISVHAGIPDFRSASGLFVSLKEELGLKTTGKSLFDADVYRDPTSTQHFHTTINGLHGLCTGAEHTPFHHFLNSLAQQDRLARLYSQNIDCLDTTLSHLSTSTPLQKPWPKTVQLHGSIGKMNCAKCGWMGELDPSLFVSEETPDCPSCYDTEAAREAAGKRPQGVGKLRPRIVLYNEHNPDSDSIGELSAADLKGRPDGLVVVGTTLKIPGVKRIVREMANAVHAMKGGVVWLNYDEPAFSKKEFEGVFDLQVKGDCQVIPQLLQDYEVEKDELRELAVQQKEQDRINRADAKIREKEERRLKVEVERQERRRRAEEEKEQRRQMRETVKKERQQERLALKEQARESKSQPRVKSEKVSMTPQMWQPGYTPPRPHGHPMLDPSFNHPIAVSQFYQRTEHHQHIEHHQHMEHHQRMEHHQLMEQQRMHFFHQQHNQQAANFMYGPPHHDGAHNPQFYHHTYSQQQELHFNVTKRECPFPQDGGQKRQFVSEGFRS